MFGVRRTFMQTVYKQYVKHTYCLLGPPIPTHTHISLWNERRWNHLQSVCILFWNENPWVATYHVSQICMNQSKNQAGNNLCGPAPWPAYKWFFFRGKRDFSEPLRQEPGKFVDCRAAIYGATAVLLNRSSGLALPGKCDALHHDFGSGIDARPGGSWRGIREKGGFSSAKMQKSKKIKLRWVWCLMISSHFMGVVLFSNCFQDLIIRWILQIGQSIWPWWVAVS